MYAIVSYLSQWLSIVGSFLISLSHHRAKKISHLPMPYATEIAVCIIGQRIKNLNLCWEPYKGINTCVWVGRHYGKQRRGANNRSPVFVHRTVTICAIRGKRSDMPDGEVFHLAPVMGAGPAHSSAQSCVPAPAELSQHLPWGGRWWDRHSQVGPVPGPAVRQLPSAPRTQTAATLSHGKASLRFCPGRGRLLQCLAHGAGVWRQCPCC